MDRETARAFARAFEEALIEYSKATDGRKGGVKRSSAKKKRAPNAYNKEFSKQMKALKKKHPRTPVTKLMKKAHSATKKARRGKR